jgi:hypothetical protein
MRMAISIASVLGLSMSAATPATAQAARAPTSGWLLDFAPTQCVASREYGSKAEPLTLAIRPSPLGDVVQLALIVPRATGRSEPTEEEASVGINGAAPIKTTALALNVSGTKLRSVRINLPRDELATLGEATRVSISVAHEFTESFTVSAMSSLFKVMDQCLGDLRREWNIDKADQLAARARAKMNIANYIDSDDYPSDALLMEQAGRVGFVLFVDETGKVADCMITQTSKVAVLDAQACAIFIARARFDPAKGADGKATKDVMQDRLHWQLP